MKTLLLFLALSLCTANPTSRYVYICIGPKATVYHSKQNCRGLNKCSGSIKKITEAEAKDMGRRRCRVCFK